jgi:hypothetical protein
MKPCASRLMLASCLLALATALATPAAARDQVDVLLIGDSITGPGTMASATTSRPPAEPLHAFSIGSTGGPPSGRLGRKQSRTLPADFGRGWGTGKFDTTPTSDRQDSPRNDTWGRMT